MSFIMALDQGTTSSRAILYDERGQALSFAQEEFEQIFPQPGWVEHDPVSIWTSQHEVAEEALRRAGEAWSDVRAIGITNQRETTVMWDRRTGIPIYNAIVSIHWPAHLQRHRLARSTDGEPVPATGGRRTRPVVP